jgi:chromatin segregation and condensation protein Rec8/ScpA/Scc1 (kleisin family)
VEEKINFILERLKEEKVLDFTQLFEECYSRLELIVSFLALLELLKLGRIRVRQFGAFGRIKIFFSAGEKKKSFRPHLVGREMNEEVRPSVHQH